MRILITGAANGIGAAVAKQALAAGHELIATDANSEALEEKWGDSDAQLMPLDVRDAEAWETVVAEIENKTGPIDVLINIAGVLRSGATGDLDPADVKLTFDVNVNGVIFGTNAVAKYMRQRKAGHIVNVGSLASLYAVPGLTVYSASKYAVRGFSLAAAADLLADGVAVTVVGPGAVKTAMLDQQRGDPNAALTFSGSRAFSPEEIAHAILGPVLTKRPLDFYLPWSQGLQGKISNVFPGLLFGQMKRLRKKGASHFQATEFK